MKTTFIRRAVAVLTLAVLSATPTTWAQTEKKQMCVVIHETDRTTAFALETRPVVSFTETDVKLECNDIIVLYSLDRYLKMTIGEGTPATGIKTTDDEPSTMFTVTGSTITAKGCTSLALYTVDGKQLASTKADADGTATLSISQLTAGIYIININDKSFKIIKR